MSNQNKLRWDDGIVHVCFGESDRPISQNYFKKRSGITNNRTLDKIQRKSGIKLSKP